MERVMGALPVVFITLALLTGIIWIFATSGPLYEREMLRFAPAEHTGLPEAEYPSLARHMADYLAGRKASFQYILTGGQGGSVACFHDYELIHMADVRGLIRLDGIICIVCVALTICAAMMWRLRRGRDGRAAIQGAKGAFRCLGMLAAALILWAVIDFDGLFITFHRLAFRNDFWLLDPRTDLMIRLMPEAMFVDMGLRGLAVFGVGEALLAAGLTFLGRRRRN